MHEYAFSKYTPKTNDSVAISQFGRCERLTATCSNSNAFVMSKREGGLSACEEARTINKFFTGYSGVKEDRCSVFAVYRGEVCMKELLRA